MTNIKQKHVTPKRNFTTYKRTVEARLETLRRRDIRREKYSTQK